MRIVLFDSILEDHTCRGLERALRALGHDVVWTGPVWKGHRFPTERADQDGIRARLQEAITPRPDLLFTFRASTLTSEMLREVRSGVGMLALWLPDDPILYDICYRHVVDSYDLMLHCGDAAVLEFYRERHGRCGVNFPFWTDRDSLAYGYDPGGARYDAVFLGNCHGPVRRARYAQLAALPLRTRILGRVDDDPAGIRGEYLGDALFEPTTLRASLREGRFGVTIPQFFRDYDGLPYDFPELRTLGYYDMPSRVVRYAAVGMPIAGLGHERPPLGFPEVVVASDPAELGRRLAPLLADRDALLDLGRRTYARYQRSFSALSRARFLVALAADPGRFDRMSVAEKTTVFADFPGESEPPPENAA
jgi:hypothetical protein